MREVVSRTLAAIACIACVGIVLAQVCVSGRPLATPDLWFHLKAGETYFHQGLWPKTDPMLFTGFETGPIQHEWLFGVFTYGVEQLGGYQGLRVVHVLLVLATLAIAHATLRRAGVTLALRAAVLAAFTVLAHQRLNQFRPDLWSIPLTVVLYSLLLQDETGPARRKTVLAVLVTLVWFNAHSLAGVGVALVAAGLFGAAMNYGIAKTELETTDEALRSLRTRVTHTALALALCLLAALVHPRGFRQLLQFFESSADTATWEIGDEWTAFNPLLYGPPHNTGSLPPLMWALADVVLAAFFVTAVLRIRAFKREPSHAQLERLDPVLFMTAAAACGAMLISVRFLWLGFFPLLYCARTWLRSEERMPLTASSAVACVVLLFAFPGPGRLSAVLGDVPRQPAEYLTRSVTLTRFADESARFLRDAGITGRLFTPYEVGAYFGYRLAPAIRTFIDSRTEHYPAQVFEEWKTISAGGVMGDGRDYLRLLDDRRVDVFLGLGPPGYGYQTAYTLARLERTPGWVLIFRNAGQALYLRTEPRNADNLERAKRYYAQRKIPFDAQRGLDVGAVLAARPDWAIAEHVVPARYLALRQKASGSSGAEQVRAQLELADMLFVSGDFRGAAQHAERVLAAAPTSGRAARIAVSAWVRAGDHAAAEALARRLRPVAGP